MGGNQMLLGRKRKVKTAEDLEHGAPLKAGRPQVVCTHDHYEIGFICSECGQTRVIVSNHLMQSFRIREQVNHMPTCPDCLTAGGETNDVDDTKRRGLDREVEGREVELAHEAFG